ncbi:trk system potassium uptake protein TrkH [Clostridium pascui]|uniref:TrkH family potassium uptake protein n=1 Tax=Clostridium pascui TaxID=46609 RepID=UPI001959ED89|nr:potassium transporter TrkG [Clostridium pascui]MBM7869946.1 trk system potassium uptake protein TrkH [Clostridium pascui]
MIKTKHYNLKLILYYTGYIILGIAMLMSIPLITAIFFKEWNVVLDFIISMSISANIGILFIIFCKKSKDIIKFEWKHGLVIAAFSWIILTLLCAIPYWLSGNFKQFIDACFDVMSGFTTTGLVLIQNLDHVSYGLNMWRHIITFVGGQGMVVMALSFLVRDTVGAYKMYVGEGKDIELVPNVKGTAKIIWIISMIYLVLGTIFLWVNGIFIGIKPVSAFFHGLFIYMSAWSTGGFAPMTQSLNYYHSLSFEITSIIFFTIGSFNFGLHYAIWQGNKKEIMKNIETQSFFITAILASYFAVIGLNKLQVYDNAIAMFRRVVYNILSAHTTTGFGNIYARQFALQWGDFGLLIIIIAMLIGGSACSTAGGVKGLRIGILFKGLIGEVKRLLSSERKINIIKYHYIKDNVLTEGIFKSSSIVVICYIVLFTLGIAIGVYYGYPLASAAFESASVAGNVGLSIGVTNADMPYLMKLYYIIAMYLGRLEFMSVFALAGFIIGGIKNICIKCLK